MARNEEKAFTLFHKWQTFKQEFHASSGNRKPLLASHTESLPEIEKKRRDIISKITKNVGAIKNASLGEMKLREMNDEINKLMKQKYYWELRIRELGGNLPIGKQFYDIEGKELPGAPGYKYYGAAKELPGIRELFLEVEEEEGGEGGGEGKERTSEEQKRKKRRTRKDIYENLTPSYFGTIQLMNRRIPNPFAEEDQEEGGGGGGAEEEENIDEEERRLRQAEEEYERDFFEDYYRTHPDEKDDDENDEELKQLQSLSKIPELILDYYKNYAQGGGGGLADNSLNPLSSSFSLQNLIHPQEEGPHVLSDWGSSTVGNNNPPLVSQPENQKNEKQPNQIEPEKEKEKEKEKEENRDNNEIEKTKQSLLSKFGLF